MVFRPSDGQFSEKTSGKILIIKTKKPKIVRHSILGFSLSMSNDNNFNNYTLNDFLSAIFPNQDSEILIRLVPAEGEIINDFNNPHTYRGLVKKVICDDSLYTAGYALRQANKDIQNIKAKNVFFRADNVIALMLDSREQFETLKTFDCKPSISLRIGNRIYSIWLLNKDDDIRKVETALLQIFKTKTLTNINGESWLPLPEFDFVEMTDDGNYLLTPIKLIHLNDLNRYTAAELTDAVNTAISQKLHFAQIENAVLDRQNQSATSQNTSSKNPISKGERTYQNFVRLINAEMPKNAISKIALSELGLKSRRVAYLLKSAVFRDDIQQVKHGIYKPKINSAFLQNLELPLAE